MNPGTDQDQVAGNVAITLAEPPAPEFVYNPWKMKDVRRLYINLTDGTKVGYLDLATLDAVPEGAATSDLLQRALAGLSPVTAARRFIHAAQLGEAHPGTPPEPEYVPPWADLAANRPGQLIEIQNDTSYRAGLAGEQRTAGVLAGLERSGFRVLHSIPVSPRKDIDHLVIGLTGIWTINTKATTYDVNAKADGAVYSDGYRQKWIESITRDAAVAGEHLSVAARMDLQCRPLVAVWSTINVTSRYDGLVAGEALTGAITGTVGHFPAEWVDVVYNVARRSDTWTAHH
ncbi:nuclease-related domain-containing protein [Arthrobacter sp. UYCo732]|uniref:nuclease-related domain-containing protein n=1 Tax=Arthrobacter sp. UYCo732 TaxID=3156336 RepID=UPI0033942B41